MFSLVLFQFFLNVPVEPVLRLEIVQFLETMINISPLSERHELGFMLRDPESCPAHEEYSVEVYFEVFFFLVVLVFFGVSFFLLSRHLPNVE